MHFDFNANEPARSGQLCLFLFAFSKNQSSSNYGPGGAGEVDTASSSDTLGSSSIKRFARLAKLLCKERTMWLATIPTWCVYLRLTFCTDMT